MDFTIQDQPARKWLSGFEQVILTSPSQFKVSTTGPGAQTILSEGPPPGKTWTITLRVDVTEV